jgi:hypothetical protein
VYRVANELALLTLARSQPTSSSLFRYLNRRSPQRCPEFTL